MNVHCNLAGPGKEPLYFLNPFMAGVVWGRGSSGWLSLKGICVAHLFTPLSLATAFRT
jgi:hypothetical protein